MQAHDTLTAFIIVYGPIALGIAVVAVVKVLKWRRTLA